MARVLTKEEQQLFNELKKLAGQANQRILRLERETKLKAPFAVKQLYDYIDKFAITKTGRARVSKSMSLKEMKIEMKALKDFLNDSYSRVSEVKKYRKELEKQANKKISYKQANTYYYAGKHYSWIYEYMKPSEFWGDWVTIAEEENWSSRTWVSRLGRWLHEHHGVIVDEELKQDLEALYIYAVNR